MTRLEDGLRLATVKLTAIVPVWNERRTVLELLHRLLRVALPVELEVVVVDDGSDDGTAAILARMAGEPGLVVDLAPRHRGKCRAQSSTK